MEAGVSTRRLLLVLAIAVALRLPFLNQAIQGDDHIYLSEAAHAQVEPLHPMNVRYVFLGDEVDLRGHSHPPLNGWILAGVLAVFGTVREVPFHAVYMVFSLIAAAAMWSLARRFSPQPLWAALLFLSVPAFVVNGNSLEADLPFLACWLASIALFCSGRMIPAFVAMALAALAAYQAVMLTPILGAYVWIFHRRDTGRWIATLVAPAALAAWQIFEGLTTGRFPATVLIQYFSHYGFQGISHKLENAAALLIHACFLVFPALLLGAAPLAWRKRREPGVLFLLAWIAVFVAGSVTVFFAGSARYLLPMAAPVALLVSQVQPKWLAAGVAAQLALALAMAVVNYQHWDACRASAAQVRVPGAGRLWIDDDLGLRHYLERRGGLPLRKHQQLRAGDVLVSSVLTRSVEVRAPRTQLARYTIQPAIPIRLIGLTSHSGYSTATRGLWPFGFSNGPIDIINVETITERHPTLEYLEMNAATAADHIVSGVYDLEENRFRWIAQTSVFVLKSPVRAVPLRASFTIPDQAPARTVSLLLDGRPIVSQTYSATGEHSLESPPVRPDGPSATVTVQVDRTFHSPGDARDLGIVLTGVGFWSSR
jgi:hypothetical protein